MSEAINEAKEALLRAFDQLDKAEQGFDVPVQRVDLIVIYCVGANTGEDGWREASGWTSTPGPKWVYTTMLRRAADAQEAAFISIDIKPEELDEDIDDADLDDPPMP